MLPTVIEDHTIQAVLLNKIQATLRAETYPDYSSDVVSFWVILAISVSARLTSSRALELSLFLNASIAWSICSNPGFTL